MRFAPAIVPFFLAACDGGETDAITDTTDATTGDTGSPTAEGLAIAGSYDDAFGTHHEIDETTWVQTFGAYDPYVFAIRAYDNAERVVIAQNDEANDYSGGLWSRFDWVESGGHLYICQSAYGAATEAEAEATPRADDADPANAGCGGFSWTDLTP